MDALNRKGALERTEMISLMVSALMRDPEETWPVGYIQTWLGEPQATRAWSILVRISWMSPASILTLVVTVRLKVPPALGVRAQTLKEKAAANTARQADTSRAFFRPLLGTCFKNGSPL